MSDQALIEDTELPSDNQSDESKARKMGWRPEEEYKGDKAKWVDAGTFLRQTEEEFPRLKHANQTLLRKVERLERGQEEIIAHQERQLNQTRKDAYEQAQRDIEAQHKQAVIAGDTDGAEKALRAAQALKVQAETPSKGGMSAADQAAVKDWIADNGWFAIDPMMADYAKKFENHLAGQGISLADRLAQTTAYIKKKFPDEFKQHPVAESDDEYPPAMINGSNNPGVRTPKPKPKLGTYEALSKEGKAACDRFVSANGGKPTAKAEWLRYATPDLFVQ